MRFCASEVGTVLSPSQLVVSEAIIADNTTGLRCPKDMLAAMTPVDDEGPGHASHVSMQPWVDYLRFEKIDVAARPTSPSHYLISLTFSLRSHMAPVILAQYNQLHLM
jgi:hypothetical protein